MSEAETPSPSKSASHATGSAVVTSVDVEHPETRRLQSKRTKTSIRFPSYRHFTINQPVLQDQRVGTDNFCSSNENQSVFKGEKYLHITKKGSLKWEGSFKSLQSFFDLFLNLQTKWSTPRGACKQYVADNGLEIRWYSSSKSLCFNGPNSENLKLQLINLIPKEQTIDGVKGEILGEILGDQTLNNEDETTNITDDEHSDVDNDKDLNAVNAEHSGVSLEKIAVNFKLLEDRMNAKFNELSHEINKLKPKSVCDHDLSHEYMQNMLEENKSLKAENDSLKQRCENLVYGMASLKTDIGNLEDEKKSLLTVIKVLQTDADLNQQANTDNHNVNGWKRVNGRIVSEKRGEALSVNKNDTVINNQFEVLSDSDIEIKSQESPFDKRRQKAININKRQVQSNEDKYERQSKDSARPNKTKVPNTVIIGDSMTKHLDSRRLQRSSKTVRRVSTQTYRGATIEDMKHHIRPSLARKPNEIILHVGTNDIANKEPEEIVNGIADIVNIIHEESPATKPVLSEIMLRTDKPSYKPVIGKINYQLQCYCQGHNLDLIQHSNLGYVHTITFSHRFLLFGSKLQLPWDCGTIENDAKTLPCARSLRS